MSNMTNEELLDMYRDNIRMYRQTMMFIASLETQRLAPADIAAMSIAIAKEALDIEPSGHRPKDPGSIYESYLERAKAWLRNP
jgi:hypothetical protein